MAWAFVRILFRFFVAERLGLFDYKEPHKPSLTPSLLNSDDWRAWSTYIVRCCNRSVYRDFSVNATGV